MAERLKWRPGDRPLHFVARPAEGALVEIYRITTGAEGVAGWRVVVRAGGTTESAAADSKQDASDRANAMWPRVAETEAEHLARARDEADMVAMLEAAHRAGTVDIEAFDVGASPSDRLTKMIWHIQRIGLQGPLEPLAKAISAELYRRRVGPVEESDN